MSQVRQWLRKFIISLVQYFKKVMNLKVTFLLMLQFLIKKQYRLIKSKTNRPFRTLSRPAPKYIWYS
jgi:hypothetical protein